MFCDLCLNYENQNNKDIEKYSNFCELITSAICDGYKIIAVNINRKGTILNTDLNAYKDLDLNLIYSNYSVKFLNSGSEITNLKDFANIKQLKRITIEISDSKDLYQFSNPNNALKSFDLISVIPKNDKMFELCCSDLNVDIITINLEEKFNFNLKKSLILSAIDKKIFFEIIYSGFIRDTSKRSLFISNVLMLLEVTKGKNIIISSGAESFYEHRSPYDISTIFATIFNLKSDLILKMLTTNCEKVLIKSVQRKYYKTVLNLVIEEEGSNQMILEEDQ